MSLEQTLAQDAVGIDGLDAADIETLVRALADSARRVHRIELSCGPVWIKRYGTEKAKFWLKLHAFAARCLPLGIFTPSPLLSPEGMVDREIRQIDRFRAAGFPTPQVIYRSSRALVLSDLGPSVTERLRELRSTDSQAHEALLVLCARELGRLHRAGLCHGRPHPRDFTVQGDKMGQGDRIGFLDFEEEPGAVMPLAAAQGRDMWLLCLVLSSSSLRPKETLENAYAAWASVAPHAAVDQLARLTSSLKPFVPFARAIDNVRRSSDIHRFVTAMTALLHINI